MLLTSRDFIYYDILFCYRNNKQVVASDKGLVVGRIQFEEDGDYIDCTKMGGTYLFACALCLRLA